MITLQDPQTGSLVHLCLARLEQRCRLCNKMLGGAWAMSTEEEGWCCIDHLERVLMAMPLSPRFMAQASAKRQLTGANPGDKVTVTGSLLAALGLDRG